MKTALEVRAPFDRFLRFVLQTFLLLISVFAIQIRNVLFWASNAMLSLLDPTKMYSNKEKLEILLRKNIIIYQFYMF